MFKYYFILSNAISLNFKKYMLELFILVINKKNMTESIITEKKKYSKLLKDYFKFKTRNKSIGLIVVSDEKIIDSLLDGLEVLSCDFVVKTEKKLKEKANVVCSKDIKKDLNIWFDFILTDNDVEGLKEYFSLWVTPIIPSNSYLSSILKEFNPLSNEWNSFLYEEKNFWSMYYSLIRYLENYKFPYDNRNLVKNVLSL